MALLSIVDAVRLTGVLRVQLSRHVSLARSLGLLPLLGALLVSAALAAEMPPAQVAVYFSPRGGATDAVVQAIHGAQHQILVQAYSFTSAPIAKALLE